MVNSDRRIVAMWPDAEVPGWNVCQLECDHLTYQPNSNTNKICHCGVCKLNHEAHMRELNALQAKIAKAAEQRQERERELELEERLYWESRRGAEIEQEFSESVENE